MIGDRVSTSTPSAPVGRTHVLAFLDAHPSNPLVFHNAAFDLGVLQKTYERAGRADDVYVRVERGQVADTQILARLISLATEGHTARGQTCGVKGSNRHAHGDLPPPPPPPPLPHPPPPKPLSR